MSNKFHYPSAQEAWIDTIDNIFHEGNPSDPRGLKTKEILGNCFSFDMNYPVCYHQNRKLSYQFMAREAWTITCGTNAVSDIDKYNKHIVQFSDNGVSFAGAYGPMFIYQRDYVINSLIKDELTRQAVFTIWKPNPGSSADHSCTLVFNFQIRNGALDCFVNMRSSDAWLGLPYDMFNFTVVAMNILCAYNAKTNGNIRLGDMHMMLNSSHLYEPNFGGAECVLNEDSDMVPQRVCTDTNYDWKFVLASLEACYDKLDFTAGGDAEGLWEIRP